MLFRSVAIELPIFIVYASKDWQRQGADTLANYAVGRYSRLGRVSRATSAGSHRRSNRPGTSQVPEPIRLATLESEEMDVSSTDGETRLTVEALRCERQRGWQGCYVVPPTTSHREEP